MTNKYNYNYSEQKKLFSALVLIGSIVISLFLILLASTLNLEAQNTVLAQSTTFTTVTTGTVINNTNGSYARFYRLTWYALGGPATCTVALDSSVDNSAWSAGNIIAGQTCTSSGSFTTTTAGAFNFARVNVTALSGAGASVVVVVQELDGAVAGGTGTTAQQVQGTAASGAAPVGNPVLVAGSDGGNVRSLLTDSNGALKVQYQQGGTAIDGGGNTYVAGGSGQFGLWVFPALFNGTSWDRPRGNTPSATVGITMAAATSTQTGTDQTNYNARGVICTFDTTIVTAIGSFTLSIQNKDEVSGKYTTIATGAAQSTVTTTTLTVYPGIAAVANVSVSANIARIWRAVATYNSGTNQTATVGCALLL